MSTLKRYVCCDFNLLLCRLVCLCSFSVQPTNLTLLAQGFKAAGNEQSTPQFGSPYDSRETFSHISPTTTRCKSAGNSTSGGGGRSHIVLEDGDFSENHPGDTGRSNHNYRLESSTNCQQYPAGRSANRASSAPIRKQSDMMRGYQGASQFLQRSQSGVGCLHASAAATATDTDNHRRGVCVPVSTGCEKPLGHSWRNNMMPTSKINQSQGHSCIANLPPRADNTRRAVGEGVDIRQTKSSASLPGLPIPRGAPRQSGIVLPGFGHGSRPGSRESGAMGSRRDQRRAPRPVRCSPTTCTALCCLHTC